MPENFIIRPALEKDLKYIKEIMNDAILHSTAIYDYDTRDDAYVNKWYKDMLLANMPILVCEHNKKCIAYGTYSRFRPKEGYKFCVEHSIYVHNGYRGAGIGKLLLMALLDKAKNTGIHVMIAGIDAKNTNSIAFHEKFGFQQVGYLKEVGYKFDRWLDLVFMQKTL